MNAMNASKVPVWVRFRNLHFSLWNSESIGKLASYLGKPLATDKLTANRLRLEYARVLVEIEISETLIESVPLVTKKGTIHLPIEYEWKPLKCINCHGLGHAIKTCREPLREIWRPTWKRIQDVNIQANTSVVQKSNEHNAANKQSESREIHDKAELSGNQLSEHSVVGVIIVPGE